MSLAMIPTRITSALLCHCLLCLSPLMPTMIPGNENYFCAALSLFAALVTFDAHLELPFSYSVNHSWEFDTKDRGGRGRLHRHIKKEEKKK